MTVHQSRWDLAVKHTRESYLYHYVSLTLIFIWLGLQIIKYIGKSSGPLIWYLSQNGCSSTCTSRGGENWRACEHCSQEMLNSCRKFVWMKICYWKFEGNLNTHVPLWVQQHMVDRHYSLNISVTVLNILYVIFYFSYRKYPSKPL